MFTMDKLLLTLTLFTLSTGVLCTVAQNQTEDEATAAEMQRAFVASIQGVPCVSAQQLREDYKFTPGMGGHKLHKQPALSWNAARRICMEERAQLAVINSVSESRMLVDWMKEKDVWDAWIGVHNQFGEWVTIFGQSLANTGFDKWLPGEPNNAGGNEHCATLESRGGMNDLTCSRKRAFFCKVYLC